MPWIMKMPETSFSKPYRLKQLSWVKFENEATEKTINSLELSCNERDRYRIMVETTDFTVIKHLMMRGFSPVENSHTFERFVSETNRIDNLMFDLYALDNTFHEVITSFHLNFHQNLSSEFILFNFSRLLETNEPHKAISYAREQNNFDKLFLQYGALLQAFPYNNNNQLTQYVIDFYKLAQPTDPHFQQSQCALLAFLLDINIPSHDKKYLSFLEEKFRAAVLARDPIAPYFFRELCGKEMNESVLAIKCDPNILQPLIDIAKELRAAQAEIKKLKGNNKRNTSSLEAPSNPPVSVTQFSVLADHSSPSAPPAPDYPNTSPSFT